MTQGKRAEVSAAQRTDIWRRWKAGESLHEIGREYGHTPSSIHLLLSHHGGIVPAVRRRSPQALTLTERLSSKWTGFMAEEVHTKTKRTDLLHFVRSWRGRNDPARTNHLMDLLRASKYSNGSPGRQEVHSR
jgi:hypothetical protein